MNNNCITIGKRDAVAVRKNKQQQRLLNDSMENLHVKFLAEFPSSVICYSLYCCLRPYCVFPLNECKLHENTQFTMSKLTSLEMITTEETDNIISIVSCNVDSKECMSFESTLHVFGMQGYRAANVTDINGDASWKQWKTMREERMTKGVPKIVTLTIKQDVKGTIGDQIDECWGILQD